MKQTGVKTNEQWIVNGWIMDNLEKNEKYGHIKDFEWSHHSGTLHSRIWTCSKGLTRLPRRHHSSNGYARHVTDRRLMDRTELKNTCPLLAIVEMEEKSIQIYRNSRKCTLIYPLGLGFKPIMCVNVTLTRVYQKTWFMHLQKCLTNFPNINGHGT